LAGLWIQVVGSKKTGKTSLLERATRELAARGRSVCYVKHRHEDARLDASDTDTARMMEAGACAAVLVGDSSTIAFRRAPGEPLAALAIGDSLPEEIVLVEGFKTVAGSKIVIAGGDLDIDVLEGVVAVVGDAPPGFKGKTIAPDDTAGLCDFIEKLADSGTGDSWATSLVIDGQEIRLNAFVQDIIASGILGMATALDGVDGADTVQVRCVKKRAR
jgi:molybdopterin-guanine dinucleotide biosynthesis protein MobB